jgi:hypothetical protein
MLAFFSLLVVISKAQDYLYQQIIRLPVFHFFFMPGVIFHELSHYLFCLLTGREVVSAKFYRFDHSTGQLGSVSFKSTNTLKSHIPNMFIGMAPLLTSTYLFMMLFQLGIADRNNGKELMDIWWLIGDALLNGHIPAWLILVLCSVSFSALPSGQDFKIAWKGIVLSTLILIALGSIFQGVIINNMLSVIEWSALRVVIVFIPSLLIILIFLFLNLTISKLKNIGVSKRISEP